MTANFPRHTASCRIQSARPEQRGVATLRAFLAAAVFMFLYEALKQAVLPELTLWQSHAITIVVGAVTAAVVAHIAMLRQSAILQTLVEEEARSERLELRQAALAESEARYRQLVEASPEAIAVHRGGRLLYVNTAGALLLGVADASSLVGLETWEFIHPEDRSRMSPRVGRAAERMEYRMVRPDGGIIEVEAASVEILYEGGPAVQTVFRDMTERKRLEARLVHEAFHDPLTGLPNRALFRDRVEHALERIARSGVDARATVLFLDLDEFKAVNDTLGHAAGDRMLVAVGERLRRATRTYDTVARLGGDEFAVLLEEVVDDAEALSVVERIRDALRAPLTIDGRVLIISASVGVAHTATLVDADMLLRNADVAMYEAKEAGKARHAVFEPAMHEAIMERLQLESDLRDASINPTAAGFSLVYQPIVELSDGSVRALEALLRWNHPSRGATSPLDFIPLAEQTGIIVPLGRWVLEQSCMQLEEWRRLWAAERRDPSTLPSVTVNISGRQLAEDDFVELVADALSHTRAPARHVTLEITESVIMQRTEDTLSTLRALKALGVRLAIDDFGTGYSSLSYLQKFPVDVLKIDRAFVEGVARGGSDAALARTIIALGDTLGLQTVAEGVEDVAQRDQLRLLGCQLGQGYLFSRPLTAADAMRWLSSGSRRRIDERSDRAVA